MIPEEIKKKIEAEYPTDQSCDYVQGKFVPTYINEKNARLRKGAEFGYSIASSEINEFKKEIERLKGLIYKAFCAGKYFGIGEMKEWSSDYENEMPDYEQFKTQHNL